MSDQEERENSEEASDESTDMNGVSRREPVLVRPRVSSADSTDNMQLSHSLGYSNALLCKVLILLKEQVRELQTEIRQMKLVMESPHVVHRSLATCMCIWVERSRVVAAASVGEKQFGVFAGYGALTLEHFMSLQGQDK